MALAGDGKVSVLMAAHNPNISQQVHFAIGMVSLKLHYTLNINKNIVYEYVNSHNVVNSLCTFFN